MDKAKLLRSMRAGYASLAAIVERIGDPRLLEPAMGAWTGKDLLAHLAWWHDHSALTIGELRGNPHSTDDPDAGLSTDELNERTHREHLADPPDVTRRAFRESFARLLAALEPLDDEELFSPDRWPVLEGEPLVEMILWDSVRHYEDHREQLESLARR